MPLASLVIASVAFAWGPHSEIMDAALATLPAADRALLVEALGQEARRLRYLVWMGDFGNQFESWEESWGPHDSPNSTVQFYANDYLIFPVAPRLYQHEMPGVMSTWKPFFRRSLQALEMETPSNAARWLGSLLHFTTDTGSPPHAAGISGDIHSKMENWISGNAIAIAAYKPVLLGDNIETASAGFEKRMEGLVDFSKRRAERLKPLISTNDRPGAEPIVLESADETARVTADLLHTILYLWDNDTRKLNKPPTGEIQAVVTAPVVANFASLPANLMLAGTNYSTTSELTAVDGRRYYGVFHFRNIPEGSYTVIVSRTGSRTLVAKDIMVRFGSRPILEWHLDPDPIAGNLIRNPDFSIRWSSADPENWRFDMNSGAWVSDNIKIRAQERYQLRASPAARESGAVVQIVWYKNHWQPAEDPIDLKSPSMELTSPSNAVYARVLIRATGDPARSLTDVSLVHSGSGQNGFAGGTF